MLVKMLLHKEHPSSWQKVRPWLASMCPQGLYSPNLCSCWHLWEAEPIHLLEEEWLSTALIESELQTFLSQVFCCPDVEIYIIFGSSNLKPAAIPIKNCYPEKLQRVKKQCLSDLVVKCKVVLVVHGELPNSWMFKYKLKLFAASCTNDESSLRLHCSWRFQGPNSREI